MAIGVVKGNTGVALNEEATAATATIQVINNTIEGSDAVIVNGVTFTETTDWAVGAGVNDTATNIKDAINASNDKLISGVVIATALTDTVTLTASIKGLAGNSLTLAETDTGTDNFTLSGALFAGGSDDEGTAVAPAAGSDFIQVQEDGLELNPTKETVERGTLTNSIGKPQPRTSVKAATGSFQAEFKASGTEGGAPEYDVALRSALGTRRQLINRVTTGTGHTTTVITITNADTIFQTGDFIVILESGDHSSHFVSSAASGSITIVPARTVAQGAPSDNVVLAKTTTYVTANSAHPAFTKNVFWGDEIREQGIGAKIATLGIENFTTGQIPILNFSHDDLSFTRVDGSAPFTPSLDSGLPPLALNVNFFKGTTCLDINEFSLSVENGVSFITSVKSSDGRVSSRISERTLSGAFNPYLDDATVTNFTDFDQDTLFTITATAQNASAVSGEFDLGSCIGIFLPNVLITEIPIGDQDGILIENISFSANRGAAGTAGEIFIGFC